MRIESAPPVQPIGASRSSRIAAASEVSVPAMLRKTVRRPKKRPRRRSGTRSPIHATQALLPITLATVLIATMPRKRWSFVSGPASSVGRARSGRNVRREMPTAQSATVLRLRAFVNQAAGRLATWAPSGSAPRKPMIAALAPEVERPAGDDGAGGAGGKNFREGALRHRGVQRAAQRRAPVELCPGARSDPGAPVSAGLEAGTDSACGIEKAEAMRASEASTAEARSVFKAAFAIARRGPSRVA